ncbi:MAG: hypothetical protein LBO67_00560 [Spirochaetaceae bacterium]|jgi:hypothetical protein|nr:hypothetical protein [Spirochaetaceae bacterium]
MKSVNEKYSTVIQKNTFYFSDHEFEHSYEGYINSLKETLLIIKNQIEIKGLKKELFEELLEKENGLRALLALTGFSNEYLKRVITIIRIMNDKELNELVYKKEWYINTDQDDIEEWSDKTIIKLIKTNEFFRKGLVNLFFEGASVPFLVKTIPLFELKKLSILKLRFEMSELIDTIIRYKEKGSYSGRKENNPETVVSKLLKRLNVTFETGDLGELIKNAADKKRTMDFIIPNKKEPRIIAESSFLATTSSGQGDKSKTEIAIDILLKKHYPDACFIGFVDEIGWYVRKHDLRRMVNAYEDVFTFHQDELSRFEQFVQDTLRK